MNKQEKAKERKAKRYALLKEAKELKRKQKIKTGLKVKKMKEEKLRAKEEEFKLYYDNLCKEALKEQNISKEQFLPFIKAHQNDNFEIFKHKTKSTHFILVSKNKKAYITLFYTKKEIDLSGFSLKTNKEGREFFEENIQNEYESLEFLNGIKDTKTSSKR
ncbi:hypothetical protein ACRBLZ_000517 [Campylobacter upsaliensis]